MAVLRGDGATSQVASQPPKRGARLSRSHRRIPFVVAVVVLVPLLVVVWWGASSSDASRHMAVGGAPDEGGDRLVGDASASRETSSDGTRTSDQENRFISDMLSMTDASATAEGWVVLDGRQGTVHLTDSMGHVVSSFARSGSGPGELASPRALTLHEDTIVVAEAVGGRIHLFGQDGGFVGSRVVEEVRCVGPGVERVASTAQGLLFLVVCTAGDGRLDARVVLEKTDGGSEVLIGRPEPGAAGSNPFFLPAFASDSETFVFGLALDECLTRYSLGGTPLEDLCHGGLKRLPVPDDLRAHLGSLQARAKRAGRTIEMPERMPPFDGVFILHSGRVGYRVPSAKGQDLRDLVALDDSGVEQLLLHEPAEYVFPSAGVVLVGWDETEGLRVARVSLSGMPQ